MKEINTISPQGSFILIQEDRINNIETALIRILENFKPVKVEDSIETFTRREASKILHLSEPTLINYESRGLIKSTRVGRRVLYTRNDINTILAGNLKHKRY